MEVQFEKPEAVEEVEEQVLLDESEIAVETAGVETAAEGTEIDESAGAVGTGG